DQPRSMLPFLVAPTCHGPLAVRVKLDHMKRLQRVNLGASDLLPGGQVPSTDGSISGAGKRGTAIVHDRHGRQPAGVASLLVEHLAGRRFADRQTAANMANDESLAVGKNAEAVHRVQEFVAALP